MKKVVLYGNSLVMSAIGASLQDCPDFEVLPVDSSIPDAQGCVVALHPDAVILDLANFQPNFSMALWKVQPDLLLIGVDLMTGKSLVLSSQPARLQTTDDLIQLLRTSPTQVVPHAD